MTTILDFAPVVLSSCLRRTRVARGTREHLAAAMRWLCRAQDVAGGGGVSGAYSMKRGWRAPYPETTGYIIPTFLRASRLLVDTDLAMRAVRMGDWEMGIQLPDGGVRGGIGLNDYPIVFNAGQVILGWLALHADQRGAGCFLEAARRAGDWLVGNQDPEGTWTRFSFNGVPHTYHTRVAWPLLALAGVTGEERYTTAARRNLEWALGQMSGPDWARFTAFRPGQSPYTHTIAYTLRGFLQCAELLDEPERSRYTGLVADFSWKILDSFPFAEAGAGFRLLLPATIGSDWHSKDAYTCLTGNVQLAIVFLKLGRVSGDSRFAGAARELINQVMALQSLDGPVNVRGAVSGSFPVWGRYMPFAYPNWAAKFFADALMDMEDSSGLD